MKNRRAVTIRLAAIAAMVMATTFSGVPQAAAEPAFSQADVHLVGNKKHWKRYNKHYNYRPYNRNWNNNYWVGPAVGLGAGILLGAIIAAPRGYAAPNYGAPAYRQQQDVDAYCSRKYRSYNRRTKTYTGYDGKQHYCRIP